MMYHWVAKNGPRITETRHRIWYSLMGTSKEMHFMILGIHHVQLTIPPGAEEAARGFYCTVLGLPEIAKPSSLQARGGLWLQVGDRQVHVGVEDSVDRHATKAHIAYEVRDIKSWRNKLASAGIEILTGIPIPGYDRFEFRDPFGNRVEMIEVVNRES
jgi:catechol 2,3-dioxygenase-like lactoylglutathione lyase family enzyme